MTAEADTQAEREIVVSRIIEGPRRLVFEAFTDVAHLGRWWGQPGATITTRSFEFRSGGVWDATIHGPDGNSYPYHITWREIVPPERLVWLYGSGKDDPHAVLTTVTLAERGTATEVTLRLLFGSKEERDQRVERYHAAEGARQSLDRLAASLAA